MWARANIVVLPDWFIPLFPEMTMHWRWLWHCSCLSTWFKKDVWGGCIVWKLLHLFVAWEYMSCVSSARQFQLHWYWSISNLLWLFWPCGLRWVEIEKAGCEPLDAQTWEARIPTLKGHGCIHIFLKATMPVYTISFSTNFYCIVYLLFICWASCRKMIFRDSDWLLCRCWAEWKWKRWPWIIVKSRSLKQTLNKARL